MNNNNTPRWRRDAAPLGPLPSRAATDARIAGRWGPTVPRTAVAMPSGIRVVEFPAGTTAAEIRSFLERGRQTGASGPRNGVKKSRRRGKKPGKKTDAPTGAETGDKGPEGDGAGDRMMDDLMVIGIPPPFSFCSSSFFRRFAAWDPRMCKNKKD
ncbi:hypothetical protein FALBO_1998 [Fusarium albosuccineum]|uniref:Uncharacterized protein n=1 Tax=Fusarium albosuccineum TaxID=1237068 RepID=A0A8H4LPA2_9HYPO|nr:hypothetical protein FALBO_1998 [Fusarium albosuccineum]